jgi:hypothetical protein
MYPTKFICSGISSIPHVMVNHFWAGAGVGGQASSCWSNEKFPASYGTRKCINLVHKRPPTVPVLSQMNPIHSFQLYFWDICFNIIPCAPCFPTALFPSGCPTTVCTHFSSLLCALHASPISFFSGYFLNWEMWTGWQTNRSSHASNGWRAEVFVSS